ncbi:bacteriohemerythrin [Maridesulfovibrio frigidus]|uniref:bacteriohemerythrin n=1 Tax=Maridesulfovibrio frigidus TaxID=340956 RepID=UPI0004E2148E|nr:hemerythrin family protein [Maridesulfovibrio frigidus]
MISETAERNGRWEMAWKRWILQSARTWDDVAGIIQLINIDQVDKDHMLFTQYALDLNLIIQALNNQEASFENLYKGDEIFQRLLDYAKIHFEHEKVIMENIKSPLMEAHLEQHAIFMKMIEDHYKDFKQGRLHIVSGLKLSVLDWWVNHINGIDYQTFVVRNSKFGKGAQ